ncbi:MAG TPA: exonuclease domain-containing protein [Steroidobacteraceae bacterium]|jgi:DNA polymerase-3 subunit epsilon|nr:exonuclease domain-containing protein [Steroidobacteraceae bacterium]
MDAPEAGELPRDLVFVDLETTGGNAAHHRITEIGIVRVRDDAVVEEWSTLVNPECVIPSYIESFTGITNEMVEGAPRFAEISGLVLEKLRTPADAASGEASPVFAAHNARFDYSFLRAEFRRAGIPFSAPVLCTVKLSRRLFPEHPRHSLDAVMERHGLSCSARHRALGDARVLSDFWARLRASTPVDELAAAAHSARNTVKLPEHLPEGLAEELPEGPGVYRFHAFDGAVLKVGKGACLRSAVLAHFAGDRSDRRERDLAAQVGRIEWEETAGELGAMLRELADTRSLEPRYNRRVNALPGGCTVRLCEDSGAVRVVAIEEMEPEELCACFGVFHSEKDARKALVDIARAKQLCLKMLGLEPSEGSCLAHQLGSCKGACVGKEPRILHAVRVQMALAALKFKAWPFPGRVALIERGAMGSVDSHVLDHWVYLGTARSDEDLGSLAARSAPRAFDAQVYRLLVRYFKNHPKLEWRDLEVAPHLGSADVY